jgi:hypothetical protein
MMERMRMFSVWPGTPGRRQQKPRMIKSIDTPACESLAQRLDDVGILHLVHLGDDARGEPGTLILGLAVNQIEQPRPHGERSYQQRGAVWLIGMTGEVMHQQVGGLNGVEDGIRFVVQGGRPQRRPVGVAQGRDGQSEQLVAVIANRCQDSRGHRNLLESWWGLLDSLDSEILWAAELHCE